MTTVKCIVCDSAVAEPLYAGILRCRECGHVFADLQLSDEQLFELYSERFFTGGEFGDYPASEPYIRRNFEARFKVLRSFLDPARHRQGVASDAIEVVRCHLVEERGHHRITIDPCVDNAAAIACYAAAGFRPVGVTRASWRDPDGVWRDDLLMEWVRPDLR